jgi:hypothetical protein
MQRVDIVIVGFFRSNSVFDPYTHLLVFFFDHLFGWFAATVKMWVYFFEQAIE